MIIKCPYSNHYFMGDGLFLKVWGSNNIEIENIDYYLIWGPFVICSNAVIKHVYCERILILIYDSLINLDQDFKIRIQTV